MARAAANQVVDLCDSSDDETQLKPAARKFVDDSDDDDDAALLQQFYQDKKKRAKENTSNEPSCQEEKEQWNGCKEEFGSFESYILLIQQSVAILHSFKWQRGTSGLELRIYLPVNLMRRHE